MTRNSSAYDTTRNYHITVTADAGLTASTPTPRALYVEHLVSQSRNAVTDVQYGLTTSSLTSVPPAGTMSLLVGEIYYVRLVGYTATQGYEQIESFINFPNTIFQVLSVSSTYTADTSAYVSSPNDKAYADACKWENDPASPNYRGCLDSGKAGGNITVTYHVKILQAPTAPFVNPQPLSSLVYDFSGSSFHYNSDYGVSARFAAIVDPSTVALSKHFGPNPTNAGGISALTLTITNPNPAALGVLNFSDSLPTSPGAMVIASPPDASTTGCGTPTFAPVAGAGTFSFSNGSVAANSTCVIKLNVTASATGTYTNTSNDLFINTVDTGSYVSDTLTVNSAPPTPTPVCGLVLAEWRMPTPGTAVPPTYSAKASDVSTATANFFPGGTGGSQSIDTLGHNCLTPNSWQGSGFQKDVIPNSSTYPYFELTVDSSRYTNLAITLDTYASSNWGTSNAVYVWSSADGGAFAATTPATGSLLKNACAANQTFAAAATGTTTTMTFRVNAYGANPSGAAMNLDNIVITGCAVPKYPRITKVFSPNPIAENGTSTLTFTIYNDNPSALTGVTFSDTYPSGLLNTAPVVKSTTCGAGTVAASNGGNSVSLSGGSVPPGGSCTVTVTVTSTTVGSYQNVSGFVSSTETGTNTGTTGSASASLTVLKPPIIAKQFAPNPILVNGVSVLTFTIINPNLNDGLTGLAFSDTYPGGVVNTTPVDKATTCGTGSVTASDAGNSLSLSGGSVTAGGRCTVTVTVTAASVGDYVNTSGAVLSTEAGSGNTASDTLSVTAAHPAIGMLKQVFSGPGDPNSASPWTSFVAVDVGDNVYYRFTVENAGDVALSPVSVSDPNIAVGGCSWEDGDGNPLGTPLSLPVADPLDNAHIAVCILGPITAGSGSHPNTATASGTYSGTEYTDSSTAMYATTGLSLVKNVTETSFANLGDELHY